MFRQEVFSWTSQVVGCLVHAYVEEHKQELLQPAVVQKCIDVFVICVLLHSVYEYCTAKFDLKSSTTWCVTGCKKGRETEEHGPVLAW